MRLSILNSIGNPTIQKLCLPWRRHGRTRKNSNCLDVDIFRNFWQ